jgi:hypothetical protein
VARHSLPRGRHARHAQLLPGGRHAASVGARHAAAVSVPVRRGIAVAAVVGGALSAAGIAVDRVSITPDPRDDDLTQIGLAADDERVVETDASDNIADSEESPERLPAVLDTEAVAQTVREANEEGERLAERQASEEADDADTADEDSGAAPAPATGGRVASKFPAELIKTDQWYLTLPTGKEGSPDTVEGSKLATYHSEYFALTPARDGIVFTANTDGVTTKNSKYPRSELREMNGEEKASWDGREGKHTMEIDQAITQTPQAKPDVIAGQIHATDDDLMQIHLSGNQLTVKYADGKKKVLLDGDYQLGQRFNVKIESSDGHVKVWYDGALKADLPISSSTSYFKAGAYVNSNGSKGDSSAAGQVVIYGLDVTHA